MNNFTIVRYIKCILLLHIILYYLPIILFNDSRDVTDKKTDKNIICEVQCALSLRIVYENSNHSKSVWWEGKRWGRRGNIEAATLSSQYDVLCSHSHSPLILCYSHISRLLDESQSLIIDKEIMITII